MVRDNKGETKGTTNKEQILTKVRNAFIEKSEALFQDVDTRSETWLPIDKEDGTAITFVNRFKEIGGIFIYLENENEFSNCIQQLSIENEWDPLWCTSQAMQRILDEHGVIYSKDPERGEKHKLVSITDCECLIAQTGSIMITDKQTRTREAYAIPDVHLVFARTEQIVSGLKEAFALLKEKYKDVLPSQTAIITGPSRTNQIEQNMIIGAQGPKQIAVFLVDD
jgi:Uncharacterized conserved protein